MKDAARWLARVGAAVARRDAAIRSLALEAHRAGFVLALSAAGTPVRLLVQSREHAERAYARTPSLALGVLEPQPLPERAEAALRRLLGVARRLDPGDLVVPITDRAPPQPHAAARATEARKGLADELHWAGFVAWKALVTEDLYPHVGPLGESVTTEEILDGWRASVARHRAGTAPDKLGLYVHVPFCTVACSFCYCGKTDRFDRKGFDAYVDGLVAETGMFAPIFDGMRFTSVYFGGGTPSLLSRAAMRKLFGALWDSFDVPRGTQIIYEGNPDSLSAGKIEVLANEGRVTRLTIGVQTLDAEVQARVRRFNKPGDVAEAVRSARESGIPHVNCDLMAGLPGQTLESFLHDLDFLLSLAPDSIHLNAFRPLPRTLLAQQGDALAGEARRLRDEMMARGREILSSNGHSAHAGQVPRRTRDAANVQEYDLRRQNSSLLGLGFPARAHAFGSFYYAPDHREGFDAALGRQTGGERRWQAIRSDDAEERHKYLVSNLHTGFARAEFRDLFEMEAEEAAPDAFEKLEALDVLHITRDEVVTRLGSHADGLLYRVLCYSPAHMARVREVWGPEYDRGVDWEGKLRRMVERVG